MQWLITINVEELSAIPLEDLRKRYFICSRHFAPEAYKHIESRSLNITAMPTLNLHHLENIEHVIHRERKQLPLVMETIEIDYMEEPISQNTKTNNMLTDSVQIIHIENDTPEPDDNVLKLTPLKRKYFGNSTKSSPIICNKIENIVHVKKLKKVRLTKIQENQIEIINSVEKIASMYLTLSL